MLQLPAGREASRSERAPQYGRHRPEQTLFYQLIEEYYPAFEAQRLKRVFSIDVEKCRVCGSTAKVIPKALTALAGQALACIEDPVV